MHVTVYTLPICQQCNMTKRKLTELGIPFDTADLTDSEHSWRVDYFKERGLLSAPIVVLSDGPGTTEHNSWSGYRPDLLGQLA